MRSRQQGNFAIGLIVGLVLGLGVALGVAVYVTKVPIPFMTKTQPRAADQDEAEARKNRDWDPNSPLYGKQPTKPPATPGAPAGGNPPVTTAPPVPAIAAQPGTPPQAATPPTAVTPAMPRAPQAANPPPSADPLGDLARARAGLPASGGDAASDPFVYFVQAGAFRTSDDAEAQRAKLSLMGVEVRVTEREQAGRPVFRVRAGPYSKKDDADRLKERLDGAGFDAALVRVQR
ncbi:SPOR domain-containing protein [Pseudacidovorax intermedius]|uniref:SPOR domain-containing protein n=1 Tax=Pseudacidovorax intermedius TaxID=433924 RepID=UPI0026EA9025|nr:SPOR domain-containing protein [Pseudacidovorax intermedius]